MGSRVEVSITLSFASASRSACASGRTTAIFDRKFADTRLKAATNGPRPDEARDSDRHEHLALSGQFDGADIGPAVQCWLFASVALSNHLSAQQGMF
jgi:hypothetical protein